MAHKLFLKSDWVVWQPGFVLLSGLHAQGLDERIISRDSIHENSCVMRIEMYSMEMNEAL